MSSSFSIEISGDENDSHEKSQSSINTGSAELDLNLSEPCASGQVNQWSAYQTTAQDAEGAIGGSQAPTAAACAAVSPTVETQRNMLEGPARSSQQLRQNQQVLEPNTSMKPQNSGRYDFPPSASQSGERPQPFEHKRSNPSAHGPQQQWSRTHSAQSQREGNSADVGHNCLPPSPSPPANANSFRASSSVVGPRRVASSGQPCEGILKRRTEKWTAQSTIGEDVVIGSKNKLWLASGSVLWRFFCCALALRIGSTLALLVVVLTTLGRMGKAVSCVDMSQCVGAGGILAFPILFRAQPHFGVGIVTYEGITESLVAGLVLTLVPMVGNCYYTCQALTKGTKRAYLQEVLVSTCCTAWVGACVGAFIPPAFFTQQFCDASNFDVNAAERTDGSPIAALSRNMCDQAGLSRACVGVALLCLCSTGMLLFQRYSRLWAALLGLGYLKFIFAGFLLCFTIMIGSQSNEMMLETMVQNNSDTRELSGLPRPMVTQLGLFFSSLKWGGCILAFANLACSAFTIWAAHLRSHLLSCTNLITNFVFFFVNAVAFFAMLFESATLRMVCNYQNYPMSQSDRARAEAAFFCTIRPQFLFMWLLVALLALIHLAEFFISAVLFQREFCKVRPKTGSLMSARSIDSLPPRWGIKR